MPWLLLDTDSDLLVEIPSTALLPETVRLQWNRLVDDQAKAAFAQKLSTLLEASLVDCLDADLKPPTAAQIQFAVAITKRLGVTASTEVFKHRRAMSAFLGEHAPTFKALVASSKKMTRKKGAD